MSNFPFNPDSVIYSEANDVFGEENEHEITDPQQDREGLEPEEQNDSTSESLPPLDRQPGVSISDQVQASPQQPHVIEGDNVSTSPIAVHSAPIQVDLVGLTGARTVPDSEPTRSSMPGHTMLQEQQNTTRPVTRLQRGIRKPKVYSDSTVSVTP